MFGGSTGGPLGYPPTDSNQLHVQIGGEALAPPDVLGISGDAILPLVLLTSRSFSRLSCLTRVHSTGPYASDPDRC